MHINVLGVSLLNMLYHQLTLLNTCIDMNRLTNLQQQLVVAMLLGLIFHANLTLCLLILFLYSWRTTNDKHGGTLSYNHDHYSV